MRNGNKECEITRFKRDILKQLYENPNIIEMLNSGDIDPDCPDTALDTHLFQYVKVPNTQETVNSYIGIRVIKPEGGKYDQGNTAFKLLHLHVYIICSFDHLNVPNQKGIRTDILAGDICETLNWNNTFGLSLRLLSESEGVMENRNYYFKELVFTTHRSNDQYGGRRKYSVTSKDASYE